jgi:hypothetical protein
MMTVVDLRARNVSDDTGIFVVRPGSNYRFYELFVENNFVGPDLPGLELPRFDDLEELKDLVAYVARSAAIRRYHLSGRREEMAPLRDIDAYRNRKFGRSTAQLARVARAYFKTMKRGDLVIVPPGSFRGAAEIGELSSGPAATERMGIDRYGTDLLLGRRVKWLASMPKSELPAPTLDALQKPSPLFSLQREFRAAIFRRAFGTYYDDNEYSVRFEVKSADFSVKDDLYLQGFFNFVSANYFRLKDREEGLLSFRQGAFEDLKGRTPSLYTNVNSPGGLSLKSVTTVTIVIVALFALAVTVGPEAHALAQAGNLAVQNSMAALDDPCTIDVHEQVVTQIRLLGYDRWVEACNFAKAAADATGLESGVNVTNTP